MFFGKAGAAVHTVGVFWPWGESSFCTGDTGDTDLDTIIENFNKREASLAALSQQQAVYVTIPILYPSNLLIASARGVMLVRATLDPRSGASCMS